MQALKATLAFFLFFILFGCAPLFQKIERPNTLYDRGRFSIVSPEGDDWYLQNTGGSQLTRFYRKNASPTHTLYAQVSMNEMTAKFDNPEKYLDFIKTASQMWDPKRFNPIEQRAVLDNKFGPYSVLMYSKVEDHHAAGAVDLPYLTMVTYSYAIISPVDDRFHFSLTYSERGKAGELDPNFEENARKFFNGFTIKGGK